VGFEYLKVFQRAPPLDLIRSAMQVLAQLSVLQTLMRSLTKKQLSCAAVGGLG